MTDAAVSPEPTDPLLEVAAEIVASDAAGTNMRQPRPLIIRRVYQLVGDSPSSIRLQLAAGFATIEMQLDGEQHRMIVNFIREHAPSITTDL